VHALLEDPATTKIPPLDAVGLDPSSIASSSPSTKRSESYSNRPSRTARHAGFVAPGDTRMYAIMSLGAIKEILYQVTMRGLDYPEDRIVDEMYRFLCVGYLRGETV
jgi:hypothetical protein